MEIDQANSKTSDEPIGSTEGAMATGRHHGQKDSSREATKGTASRGIEDVNRSTVLAQISSRHQPNTFAHPDPGNTMDVDGANMGKSGKPGTTHLDEDNAMDIDEANGEESGQRAETSNNSVPRRSNRDRNPLSDNKKSIAAPTKSRKRSKKRSNNRNPLKPKEKLATLMEETAEGDLRETILIDITIDEIQADMVSTLDSRTCSEDSYSRDRWRPREGIWRKLLRNKYDI
jgi:hypothetical protein